MIVRKATVDDARAIVDCLHAAFASYRHRYSAEGFRDTTLDDELVHWRLKSMSVFVAATGTGEIVGTVACSRVGGDEGHIRGMAVLPKWQGRGIAEQLLDAAENEVRAGGCTRVTLDTTPPLQRAMRFYEKNGYRRTGVVDDFFGMPLFQYVKRL